MHAISTVANLKTSMLELKLFLKTHFYIKSIKRVRYQLCNLHVLWANVL